MESYLQGLAASLTVATGHFCLAHKCLPAGLAENPTEACSRKMRKDTHEDAKKMFCSASSGALELFTHRKIFNKEWI